MGRDDIILDHCDQSIIPAGTFSIPFKLNGNTVACSPSFSSIATVYVSYITIQRFWVSTFFVEINESLFSSWMH